MKYLFILFILTISCSAHYQNEIDRLNQELRQAEHKQYFPQPSSLAEQNDEYDPENSPELVQLEVETRYVPAQPREDNHTPTDEIPTTVAGYPFGTTASDMKTLCDYIGGLFGNDNVIGFCTKQFEPTFLNVFSVGFMYCEGITCEYFLNLLDSAERAQAVYIRKYGEPLNPDGFISRCSKEELASQAFRWIWIWKDPEPFMIRLIQDCLPGSSELSLIAYYDNIHGIKKRLAGASAY